jgi:acyl-CoA dehydrogenase family protein 9
MTRSSGFAQALFFGEIRQELIVPYPTLSAEERRVVHGLAEHVRKLCQEQVDAAALDRAGVPPPELLASMRALGLFGLEVPSELGGRGLSRMGSARILTELSAGNPSLGLLTVAHGSIAMRALLSFGTDAQKQRWVPALARGERFAALALTEAASGTDAAATRTRAVKVDDGWRLSGQKPWVSNGELADVLIVFARTSRFEEGQKPRLTAFIVERGPGVDVGRRRDTLGLHGAGVASVDFRDVKLPADAVLGEVGKGFRVAMAVMSDARVGLGAWLFGQLKALIDFTIDRVQTRRSFGRVIGEFPIIKNKITKMLADAYAVESMTYLSAGLADRGASDLAIESSVLRVAASEALWRAANEAMQIAGGSGYLSSLPIERLLRDARGGLVVDGTNETVRCFIALTGLRSVADHMGRLGRAIPEPASGVGLLRELAARSFKGGAKREHLSRAHPLLSAQAQVFDQAADAFARATARILREHGREVSEMQMAQVRIANIMIDLYALAACISRTSLVIEQRGESGARRELDLTAMFATAARARMAASLGRLERNDDGVRRSIASRTYTDGGYPFDVI